MEVGSRSAEQSSCFIPWMRQRQRQELWIKPSEWMQGRDRCTFDGELILKVAVHKDQVKTLNHNIIIVHIDLET